jgi:hypothetical protein
MWQPAVEAVYRAGPKQFSDAYANEHDIRVGILNSDPLSLRELQMLALAYVPDGAGLVSLEGAERQLADIKAYRCRLEEAQGGFQATSDEWASARPDRQGAQDAARPV